MNLSLVLLLVHISFWCYFICLCADSPFWLLKACSASKSFFRLVFMQHITPESFSLQTATCAFRKWKKARFAPSQVVLVRWNEPFQKLATCDMEGGIFVWIQYEGRWSVELVNDRGAQVCNFIIVFQ